MQQVTSKAERYALFDVQLGSGPTKWWRNLKHSRKVRLSKVRRRVGKKEIAAQLG